MSEFTEDWECAVCGAPLGNHPRGVELVCSVCGERIVTPGFDNRHQSKRTIEFLTRLKANAKKHAQDDYKAMRER